MFQRPRPGPPSPRVRPLRGVAAYTETTTSATPAAIAEAACSTNTSKLEPPVDVESVNRGRMPRNSASCRVPMPVPPA